MRGLVTLLSWIVKVLCGARSMIQPERRSVENVLKAIRYLAVVVKNVRANMMLHCLANYVVRCSTRASTILTLAGITKVDG
mmetsp:Transcript_32109/g.73443  ORF Transcript_32109/g.73443 Transcript_32109/m.73443 type:complete len:81 (-) Transcript_32109:333-575(-)